MGFVSVSIDMSWRDRAHDANPTHVLRGVEAFLADPAWTGVLNRARIGLVGHSAGASEVNSVADQLAATAVAVLGPREEVDLGDRPNLVIGDDEDDINGDSTLVFRSSPRRTNQHLLFFYNYAHYAFFEDLCGGIPRVSAAVQRGTSFLALERFFDKYLRDGDVADDLGIAVDPPGEPGVRFVCPGGEGC